MFLVRCLTGPPCPDAIQLAASVVYLVIDDNAELVEGSVILTDGPAAAAIAKRTDLESDHPLYLKRALVAVPSGFPDFGVDSNGDLTYNILEISNSAEAESLIIESKK